MADTKKIITLDNLSTFKTNCDALYAKKTDVTTGLNGKLDKFSEKSETSRIYLVSKDGYQAMGNVDFTATAYYIPRYSAQATITTQTPKKDIDCANKKYVDTTVSVYAKKADVDSAIAKVAVEVIDLASRGN